MNQSNLSPNTISFIGLATEYCTTIEQASTLEKDEFVVTMLRLLPRLYISMSDVTATDADAFTGADFVDEAMYDNLLRSVAALMGEDDTYLETFEEDMKYSDTPIGASVAEGLCDIFQDLCNFVVAVRDSEGDLTEPALAQCKENFGNYWSQTLCNVLRALNHIHYK